VTKGVNMKRNGSTSAETGIGFGCALAMVISFVTNKSILWAILHGIFSWFYVIYYALGYGH
jgi:hypothetical protein